MPTNVLPPWPWDTAPAPLIDAVASQLRAMMTDEPIYLLVDPVMGEPEVVQLPIASTTPEAQVTATRTDAWQRDVHSLYSTRFESRSASDFSYLVRLAGTSDPLLRASVMWAIEEHIRACAIGEGTYRFGGWLQAFGTSAVEGPDADGRNGAAEGARLARHLSNAIEAQGLQGRIVPLRITDRRVLHTLQAAGSVDWRLVKQGIRRWCYLDYNLQLCALEGEPGAIASRGAWNGSPDQWVTSCAAINRTQTFLLGRAFPLTLQIIAAIPRKLDAAQARGLHDIADIAAYASEAILEPRFEAWGGLEELVANTLQTHQDMSDAIASNRPSWATRRQDHELGALS